MVVLVAGTAAILIGIGRLARDIATEHLLTPVIFAGSVVLVFAVLLNWLGKVSWISDVHEWLDGHFFRLLEKSNLMLFEGLIVVLDPWERARASGLGAERKESLANAVFIGLSKNNSLFTHLLRTGIFRLWIWYWIAMYGTFIFTILTVESFSLVLRGVDQYAKAGFSISWSLALLHLVSGVLMGRRLLRMMEDVARLLVRAHRDEITTILRKNISEGEQATE